MSALKRNDDQWVLLLSVVYDIITQISNITSIMEHGNIRICMYIFK